MTDKFEELAEKERKREELRTMQDAVRKVEVTGKLQRIVDNKVINDILENADLDTDWENVAEKARLKAQQRESCVPFIYPELNSMVQLAAGSLALFAASTGTGKCFAKGTKVLMHDGSIKAVEDVVVGDLVMGPDSQSRTVLSLGRGREQMYDIVPTEGDKYTVNESHIVSLKLTTRCEFFKEWDYGDIVNISVRDLLKKPKTFLNAFKGYHTGVEYDEQYVQLHPYLLGYWLGDKSSGQPSFHAMDLEAWEGIINIIQNMNKTLPYPLHIKPIATKGLATRYDIITEINDKRINPIVNALQELNIYSNKDIPNNYLVNSRAIRLQLLAGIIDSNNNNCNKNKSLDFCFKSEKLTNSVVRLCRSLGFAAHITPTSRICVSGDLSVIPTKIPRKQHAPREQIKDVCNVGISIKKVDVQDYYGFEVSGDHLFLLADYTVVHNSTLVANIAKHLVSNKKKVLIIVNEEESDDVGARISCLDLGISIHKYKVKGGLSEEEKNDVIDNMVNISRNYVTICGLDFKGKSSITTSPEGMKALLTRASGKFDAILIDYYQNVNTSIKHPGLKAHEANEMFANDLDYFKNTVGCPIMLMAQIRRGDTDYKDRLEGRRLILNKCTDIFELKTDKEHSRSIMIVHKDRWLGNQGSEIPLGYRGGAYILYNQQFEEEVANMRARNVEKLGEVRDKDFNVDKLVEQKLGKKHSDMLDKARAEMEKK